MRLLTLVRHAKSSWADPGQRDFDRPLNERGRRDIPRMAPRALEQIGIPDRIVSSPAVRALSTARGLLDAFGLDDKRLRLEASIYEAPFPRLLELARQLDDADTHVMLVGHNPGLTDLAQALAPCPFDDLPTCAMVQIGFQLASWRALAAGEGTLCQYLYPKQFRDSEA